MNTRSFIKTSLLALVAGFLAPLGINAEPPTNDTDLRSFWRDGKRVRMQQLRKGDRFEVELFEGTGIARRQKCLALSYPNIVRHPERPGEYTWGIQMVEVESIKSVRMS